jgi:hypothetical protein
MEFIVRLTSPILFFSFFLSFFSYAQDLSCSLQVRSQQGRNSSIEAARTLVSFKEDGNYQDVVKALEKLRLEFEKFCLMMKVKKRWIGFMRLFSLIDQIYQ